MKTNKKNQPKTRVYKALAALGAACGLWAGQPGLQAQTTSANLSPDLQPIVKFAQAHMSDDVVLAYIKGSGKVYNLSADDLLYLNSQGVSQAVITALLQTKSGVASPAAPAQPEAPAAPAPQTPPAPSQPAYPPPAAPTMPPPMPGAAPAPGLLDNFSLDAGLNPSFWTAQGGALAGLASAHGSPIIPPMLGFGPAGMQLSGANGKGLFAGVQSVQAYMAPFNVTATVAGQEQSGIPFELYLVSADLRQWVSLAGHLGGIGHPEGRVHVGGGLGFFHGGVSVPLGGGPSPDYGVWVNWSGSGLPISALGRKIHEHVLAGVPYTIQMSVDASGLGSVSFLDAAGITLGALNALPVGTGPFYAVLASRNGPTFANWSSIQVSTPAPPVAVVPVAAPATPTFDYFQGQLTPYGNWIEVPGVGSCWVPNEQYAVAGWRPYAYAGHWEYTDAGWYWQSDYPWGEIAFHYGRWINDARTGFVWAWAPAYDWAPAWVAWRYADADGCMGWAPLPWEARYEVGVGIVWRGHVGVDLDFGLGADAFIFIGRDHFWDHDYHAYFIDRERVRVIYARSEIHNGYRMDHGRFVVDGWGRDRMARFTHHEVRVRDAHELRRAEEHHNLEARREDHARVASRMDSHARPEERSHPELHSRPEELSRPESRPGGQERDAHYGTQPGNTKGSPYNSHPTQTGGSKPSNQKYNEKESPGH